MTNRGRLIGLMRENKASCKQVAEIVKRSVSTVKIWRSKDSREIPEWILERLEAHYAPKS